MIVHQLTRFILVSVLIILAMPEVNAETRDQQIKVLLRTVGHEFLLQMGDSTSRVLPIQKVGERYAVQFERTFAFEPDLLLFASIKTLEESKIIQSYIVEVEECETNDIIHSFQAGWQKDDNLLPCGGRVLPDGCYVFFFTVAGSAAGLEQGTSSINSSVIYLNALLVLTIGVGLFVYLNRKKRNAKRDPDLLDIGQYQFDQKRMILTLKEKSIKLSGKEADLLSLLCSHENETLERDHILRVIWGDEGDYVGRTLDVFISKLRKKLEADPGIKITNVRGVGYRLIIA